MPISSAIHLAPLVHTPRAKRLQKGFTAIELMVVVAIVAILAALAGPSFTPLIERWRVRSAAENLTSSLYLDIYGTNSNQLLVRIGREVALVSLMMGDQVNISFLVAKFNDNLKMSSRCHHHLCIY